MAKQHVVDTTLKYKEQFAKIKEELKQKDDIILESQEVNEIFMYRIIVNLSNIFYHPFQKLQAAEEKFAKMELMYRQLNEKMQKKDKDVSSYLSYQSTMYQDYSPFFCIHFADKLCLSNHPNRIVNYKRRFPLFQLNQVSIPFLLLLHPTIFPLQ